MTTITRLTGQSLVDYVNEQQVLLQRGETNRTDMIREAGYLNWNGTAAYVDFYTELLKAKEADPSYVARMEAEEAEYTDLSGVEQDLYDAIHDKFGEKWDHETTMEFMQELDDIGIETPEHLDEAYEYQTDEYNADREFARYIVVDVLDARIPEIVEDSIDWDNVWNSYLSYDYNTIEFHRETYYFRNI